MREEKVTVQLLEWLENNNWKIICYDFPQSGTGKLLRPNCTTGSRTKNKGGIIPDILAVKDNVCLFFENKDRFVFSDFQKIKSVKELGNYSEAINALLIQYPITHIYYGIGIPAIRKEINKALKHIDGLDFLLTTDISGNVYVEYDLNKILFHTS